MFHSLFTKGTLQIPTNMESGSSTRIQTVIAVTTPKTVEISKILKNGPAGKINSAIQPPTFLHFGSSLALHFWQMIPL